MYITSYKRSGRSEPLFIFRFYNEADLESAVQSWLTHVDALSDEKDRQYFRELVTKIRNRADSKYAAEAYALSSSLFYDEFVRFSDYLAVLLACAAPVSTVEEACELVQRTSCHVQQLLDIQEVFMNARKTDEDCETTLCKIFAIVVRNYALGIK